MKIEIDLVDQTVLTGGRLIKCVHIGSFPNASAADMAAAYPLVPAISQRLDYKQYPGS